MKLIDTILAGFGGEGNARASLPAGSQYNPEQTNWDREKQRKGGPDKGGIVSARKKKKRKTKTLNSDAAGSQSEGSSKTARSYRVTDGMGRVLHKFRTKEEAEQASAGNRYTRVVSQIPPDEATEVRDNIRRRPGGNNKVKVFRRTLPYGATMFPQGPTSR